jgi:hypothetical protein
MRKHEIMWVFRKPYTFCGGRNRHRRGRQSLNHGKGICYTKKDGILLKSKSSILCSKIACLDRL